MIAVDTSALVAIAFGEEDAGTLLDRLTRQDSIVGALSLVEAYLVVHNQTSTAPKTILADLLSVPTLRIVPFTQTHAALARDAYLRYGRGRGHRANLNFGDCLAYAVAKRDGLPLLFKGDDFVHTDLIPAAS
ncbi:MAG: type II toxin-antitoxin system VapC family toxin [Methylobacterium sp.]|uniref:type II toxin-antitoxin system VapC family toxin n=1 Tax=Methylobacterium sp. TaxID=409 RepID=UPI002582E857|nr:type II toxin-antitoxin system VapC family toxin [Methylobacterium sp.]MBY0296500.1 type II toxin-antitoxin system VapC family toxin [Methylobacterium sp.]